MSNLEYELNMYMNTKLSYLSRCPQIMIWIDTPVDVCYDRCKLRARTEEDVIDKEFLEEVQKELHKTMMRLSASIPVFIVDGTKSPENICKDIFGEVIKKNGFYHCPACDLLSFHKYNFFKHIYSRKHLMNHLIRKKS